MTPEEETLEKIKFVLLCKNDSQAIRIIEQYGDYKKDQALQLLQTPVMHQLCGFFEVDSKNSSATKCKCGREKWEHPKAK